MEGSKTNCERPHLLCFNEIKQAADHIESGIIHTPLCEAKLSKCLDYDVYLKCENLQYTGSCVERGIRNTFLGLASTCTEKGVVVPSQCGNLGIAAAYHGRSLRVPVTAVMPNSASPALAQRCLECGADVVLCGNTMDDVMAYAKKVHRECNQLLLTSDHPLMMAGLGTVGIEIITQLPEADAVIVPVATGGLLAGILVACKKLKCSCLVYGAECAKVPKMMKALQAGSPTSVPLVPSLAEGLNVPSVGPNAFSTIKGWLDRMLVVDEKFVARAVISMLEQERMVADGAGVCAIAALMQGLVPELQGKRVVCVVTGGNISCDRLCRVVQRGLGASGRLVRFAVPVPDQRIGLEKLSKAIGAKNGVIKSIVTEPMWVNSDVSCTCANVVVEVANEEQGNALKDHIRDCYPGARFACADPIAKR